MDFMVLMSIEGEDVSHERMFFSDGRLWDLRAKTPQMETCREAQNQHPLHLEVFEAPLG